MVHAPFTLQTVSAFGSGQAPRERWYIMPFRLLRYQTLGLGHVFRWGYAYSKGQYVGCQLFYAGKSTWRQI